MPGADKILRSESVLRAFGLEIPARSIARPGCVVELGWLAKAAVELVYDDGHRACLTGFATAANAARALELANYELLERIFATWPLLADQVDDEGRLPVYRWPEATPSRRVACAEIALGPTPFGSAGLDSSGLAYHVDRERAVRHAIRELRERDTFARLWYGEHTIAPLGEPALLACGASLRRFRCNEFVGEPFVLAVVDDESRGLLVCGASVRATLADAEALMLLDGKLAGDRGPSDSDEMDARLASLEDPILGARRRRHLQTRLRTGPREQPTRSLEQREYSEFDVAILAEDAEACVVRVRAPGLWTLTEARADPRLRERAPEDPFC